ncbi:MAG TPA: dihydrodipicolinate synthase family protein [Rhizomicrobium sp.]|jgi:4-hydroxy-tetrahydrodipicolinate synthase|nr:dihydrodipicolinate synthase family protein [Rhizomicrobium sp.]
MKPDWKGVWPAATTQFADDLSLDLPATQKHVDEMIRAGVHGIIALGTCGENASLSAEEKRHVLSALVEVSKDRVPVVSGVTEFTTPTACDYARDAKRIGVSGLMVLPAMVYVPTADELVAHFTAVARATDLPVMLYNNPTAYRVNITNPVLEKLAAEKTIVAIKESAEDTRRFTDLFNAFGDRFLIFAGLDDVAYEGLALGAVGWVSGLTSAFPEESVALYNLMMQGKWDEAREIYRWFMPLLHLDAGHDLVQCIKLAEQTMGHGSERVRPPRYVLSGQRRDDVIAMTKAAAAKRPSKR